MAKVFVTGAAGYIGEGVALAFRRHGYRVYGLVRSAEQARSLRQKEITAVIGKQDDPSSYKHILAECAIVVDAIGHNAFSQKFVELVVDAHASRVKAHPSYKPLLIFTSGIMTYGNASKLPVDETVIPRPIFQDQGRRTCAHWVQAKDCFCCSLLVNSSVLVPPLLILCALSLFHAKSSFSYPSSSSSSSCSSSSSFSSV